MTTASFPAALDGAKVLLATSDTELFSSPKPPLLRLPERMSESCRALFLGFIERLEQFAQACQRGDPHEALDTLFPQLLHEIEARFAHEENLMQAADFCDGSDHAHAAQHHEILLALQMHYHQRVVTGYAEAATKLGHYVQHQMMFHVSSADCELARRLLGLPPIQRAACN